jgi:ribosomal protein S18 acetylase RimI-like enzyme
MTASVVLRPARADDAETIAEIWRQGWRDGHLGHVPQELVDIRTEASFATRSLERIPDATVATVDGAVVGFIMVVDDEVEQIYVSPAHFGKGVAGALMTEAESQVAASGHDVAWLAVAIGNTRARAFYEKTGWVNVGDLPYEVEALGEKFISPCRRYEKGVR